MLYSTSQLKVLKSHYTHTSGYSLVYYIIFCAGLYSSLYIKRRGSA